MIANIANSLSSPEYVLSLPIILLLLFAAGILLIDLVTPPGWKMMNAITALAGVMFAAGGVLKIQSIQAQLEESNRRLEWAFRHTILVDHVSIYFEYLALAIAAFAIVMLIPSQKETPSLSGKSFVLILLTVLGMMLMVCGFDIVIIFVGLALVSATSYLLEGSLTETSRTFTGPVISLAIFATALGLLYGVTGSSNLQLISQALKNGSPHPVLTFFAIALTALGLFLKLFELPIRRIESFRGSAVVAGFICTAFQAATWTAILRIFLWGLYPTRTEYVPVLIVASLLCMIAGTFFALAETSTTRLLAFASVVHAGVMALGLVSLASVTYPAPAFFEGFKGLLIYLAGFAIANMGAFAAIARLERGRTVSAEMESLGGLWYRDRLMAIIVAVFLASLAGIPLLGGFYGKYFVIRSAFASVHSVLAVLAVLCTLVSCYYYGRMAQVMFMRIPEPLPREVGIGTRTALGIAAALIVAAGFYPKPLIDAAEWALRLTYAAASSILVHERSC